MSEVIKTVLTADGSGHVDEFQKAAGAVKDYQARIDAARKRSKEGAQAEVHALRLEVAGQKKVADQVRATARMREEAARLARRSGMAEEKALELLKKRAKLEAQLEAQRARGAQRVNLRDRSGVDLQSLDRMRVKQDDVAKSSERMRAKSQRAAMGFLELSRAVEDAQYGFRGVINNVPGMVQSFGGGAGLAGAISLSVVGFYQLGKAYVAWLEKTDGSKAVKAQAEAWRKVYEEQMRALSAGREAASLAREMATYQKGLEAADGLAVSQGQSGRVGLLQAKLSAYLAEADAVRQVESAKLKLAQAEGGVVADSRKAEMARLREELDLRRELVKAGVKNGNDLDFEAGQQKAGYERAAKRNREELEALENQLARAKADLAGEKEAAEKLRGREQTNARENVKLYEDQVAELERKVERLKAVDEAQQAAAKKAAEVGEAAKNAQSEWLTAEEKKIRALEREIELQEKLAGIQSDRWLADFAKGIEEETRGMLSALEKMQREKERAEKKEAEEKKRVGLAREDFAGEMRALELEAQGRKEAAELLRKELELRREARDLAKRLEVTEENALRMLREREALQRRIDAGERKAGGGEGGSKIKRYTGSVAARGGATLRTGGAFLRSELQRRNREAAKVPRERKPQRAEEWLERQVSLQEQLLKVWEGIQTK